MKIIWSNEALQRLIEIEAFLAEDKTEKSVEFTDYLVNQSLMIEENPEIGRVVPVFMDKDIRELLLLLQGHPAKMASSNHFNCSKSTSAVRTKLNRDIGIHVITKIG